MKSEVIILDRVIPVYGLLGAAGILLGMLYIFWQCRRTKCKFDDAVYIYVGALILAMLGAKLLYVLQQLPALIYAFSQGGSHVLEMLHDIISGGFVYYGGLIGAIIGAFLMAKYFGLILSDFYCALVPTIPLIHAFGRMGCFLTGCCYGKETSCQFHIVYESSQFAPNGVPLIPVQLIEAGLDLLIFLFLHVLSMKEKQSRYLPDIYILCYAAVRFILEFFRGDFLRGHFWMFSTSQWISILFVIAVGIHIKKQKKGENNIDTRG